MPESLEKRLIRGGRNGLLAKRQPETFDGVDCRILLDLLRASEAAPGWIGWNRDGSEGVKVGLLNAIASVKAEPKQ